jgi:hypothetical protein
MAVNLDRFKKDLAELAERGMLLRFSMILETLGKDALKQSVGSIKPDAFEILVKKLPYFKTNYEKWYSECLVLIRQIIPDMIAVFTKQYEKMKNRKALSYESYVIEDYMIGLKAKRGDEVIVDASAAIPKLIVQTSIL